MRVKRQLGTLILLFSLILVSIAMGWLIHEWHNQVEASHSTTPELITVQDAISFLEEWDAISFLEECRDTHQVYADNESLCNEWTGNVTRHQDLIRSYDQVIDLFKKEGKVYQCQQ